MTEQEWMSATSIELGQCILAMSQRKQRLFAVDCCRQLGSWIDEPVTIAALDTAERYVDGKASLKNLAWENKRIQRLRLRHYQKRPSLGEAATRADILLTVSLVTTARMSGEFIGVIERAMVLGNLAPTEEVKKRLYERYAEASGNSSVRILPDWQTSTAVGLAQAMYDARDFGAMPILADALQDAGCEDDAILSHCRDPHQVHVRGCWVVDGVLGKQ